MRAFISYAREDLRTARRLARDLEAAGIATWIDKKDLLPGQDWAIAVTNAIKTCSYFIALLSSVAVSKRGYVQREIRLALETLDQLPPDEIFVIPVRLDSCTPRHPRLQQIEWIDLFPSYKAGLDRLLLALDLDPGRRQLEEPVLGILDKAKDGLSFSELQASIRASFPSAQLSKLQAALDHLEREGLIRRDDSAGTTKYSITTRGRYSMYL